MPQFHNPLLEIKYDEVYMYDYEPVYTKFYTEGGLKAQTGGLIVGENGKLTPQESKLWLKLRNNQLNVSFRKQHSIGKYIVDFAMKATLKDVRLPKCVRDGIVKPIKKSKK